MNTRERIILPNRCLLTDWCCNREYQNQIPVFQTEMQAYMLVWKHLTFLVTAGSVLHYLIWQLLRSIWFLCLILKIFSFTKLCLAQSWSLSPFTSWWAQPHSHVTSKTVPLIQTLPHIWDFPIEMSVEYLSPGYLTDTSCSIYILNLHFPT